MLHSLLSRSRLAGAVAGAVMCASPVLASGNDGVTRVADLDYYKDGKLRWTASTSAQMRFVVSGDGGIRSRQGQFWDPQRDGSAVTIPSPDRSAFSIVEVRGDLGCNCNISTLRVYRVHDVAAALEKGANAPAPWRKVEMRSKNGFPISDVQWSADGRAIDIRGSRNADGPPGFYQLELKNGAITELAKPGADEQLGDSVQRGGVLVFGIFRTVDNARKPLIAPLTKASRYRLGKPEPVTLLKFRASYRDGGTWDLPVGLNISRGLKGRLSPDGRFLIMETPIAVGRGQSGGLISSNRTEDVQLALVDLIKRHSVAITEPTAGRPLRVLKDNIGNLKVFWSPDSRSIILKGVEAAQRGAPSVVSYDLATGRLDKLESIRSAGGVTIGQMLQSADRNQILISRNRADGTEASATVYRYTDGRWSTSSYTGNGQDNGSSLWQQWLDGQARQPIAPLAEGLQVFLRQSPNDPPMVIAKLGQRELHLLGPDAILQQVWIAPSKPYVWNSGTGTPRRGQLTLPRNAPKDGSKIPLVIQLYHPCPECDRQFLPDGVFSNGMARQALAARGMAVLSFSYREAKNSRAATKLPSEVMHDIEVVVADLASHYPIDVDRVGLSGFSFTGMLARYAFTHSKALRFAAAVADDSAAQNFVDYVSFSAGESTAQGVEWNNGGSPFYENKQGWLAIDTAFNADRVKSPFLVINHSFNRYQSDDPFGTYTLARRPFEVLSLDEALDGDHVLTNPLAIKLAKDATVDWFDFWLNGRETPRVDDPDRYVRWRKIKADWEAQQAWEARGYPVTSKPDDSQVINHAAYKALYEEKNIAKALRFFRDNVAVNPNAAWVYVSLGEGYLQAGSVAKAIEAYNKAIDLDRANSINPANLVKMLREHPRELATLQKKMRAAYATSRDKDKLTARAN